MIFSSRLWLTLALMSFSGLAVAGEHTPTFAPDSAVVSLNLKIDLDSSRRQMKKIEQAVRREHALDAKRQVFKSRYWARADVRLLADLDAALTAAALEDARQLATEFLEAAADAGYDSFETELSRLSTASVASLARSLDCGGSTGRECVARRYRQDAAALLAADIATIAEADLAGTVDWLADLQESLQPSIKTRGRTRRKALAIPAFPFVNAWRKKHSASEYEGPQWVDFEHYRFYEPQRTVGDGGDLDLLARYAPVLVQETNPSATYPQEDDRIGRFVLETTRNQPMPRVETDRPVSYSYLQKLSLDDVELTQLVYTYWYPEHPKFKWIDVGAGKIEGITLRITVDPSGRPLFYETVYNCGCSHRLFVDSGLEAAAAAEFGAPEGDRHFSIQRHLPERIDLVVPEVVDFEPDRPLFFLVRAGFHMPASVSYSLPEGIHQDSAERYELRPYEELERMPYGDGWASIFNHNGLVKGASRPLEEILLTPLGILKAGHPRQRGTQLIHFDQADFDDPQLFETYLRLPANFYETSGRYAQSSSPTTRAGSR